MPNWPGIDGCLSMSILTSLTLPLAARTTFSSTGASCLQGPHHSAQKSTSTGWRLDSSSTSFTKVCVVVSLTAASATAVAPAFCSMSMSLSLALLRFVPAGSVPVVGPVGAAASEILQSSQLNGVLGDDCNLRQGLGCGSSATARMRGG